MVTYAQFPTYVMLLRSEVTYCPPLQCVLAHTSLLAGEMTIRTFLLDSDFVCSAHKIYQTKLLWSWKRKVQCSCCSSWPHFKQATYCFVSMRNDYEPSVQYLWRLFTQCQGEMFSTGQHKPRSLFPVLWEHANLMLEDSWHVILAYPANSTK